MKFSMWNFKEWFDKQGIDLSYQIMTNTPSISMIDFSDLVMEKSSSAHILSNEQLEDCSGFNSVLQYQNDRILFPIASPVEVANQANRMIREYSVWERELTEGIMEGWNLSELFLKIQEKFQFPFTLLLPSGSIFDQTKDWELYIKENNRQTIIQHALKDINHVPVCKSFRFDPSRSYMLGTVMNAHKPAAILVSYENGRRFQPGHITLFYSLLETLELYLRYHTEMSITSNPLSFWFQKSIETPEDVPLSYSDTLLDLNWQENHYYQVIAVGMKSDQPDSILSDLYYRLASLSMCCAMADNTLFILIHYGPDFPFVPKSHFLNSVITSSLCSGISLPFQRLTTLREYLWQAEQSLEYARRKGIRTACTEDQLNQNLLDSCHTIPETRSLIHPDILALEKENEDNSENLLRTLYTYYIQGCSHVRASQALYIHRNTFRNRMQKIKEILSLDPDSDEALKQYLPSLIICQN